MSKKKIEKLGVFIGIVAILIAIVIITFTAETRKRIVTYTAMSEGERSTWFGKKEIVSIIDTKYETISSIPNAQFSGGMRFPAGGAVFVDPEKGKIQTYEVDTPWGEETFLAHVGEMNSKTGKRIDFPASDYFYYVRMDQTIAIERYKVDVYRNNKYQKTYYTSSYRIIDQSYALEKVK